LILESCIILLDSSFDPLYGWLQVMTEIPLAFQHQIGQQMSGSCSSSSN